MSVIDLTADRRTEVRGRHGEARADRIGYKVRTKPDSKSLYRDANRLTSLDSDNYKFRRPPSPSGQFDVPVEVVSGRRSLLRPTNSRQSPRQAHKQLERFQGFVEKVEGDLAYVTLTTDGGKSRCGPYPAAELAAKGVGERDRFVLTTIDSGDAVRFDIRAVPRRVVSPGERAAIRERIAREIGDYTMDDDY